jgi:hypothetical protein
MDFWIAGLVPDRNGRLSHLRAGLMDFWILGLLQEPPETAVARPGRLVRCFLRFS